MAKMTYTQFREIVGSLSECPNFESFQFERGWQEWMEAYEGEGGSPDEIVRVLQLIWTLRDNPILALEQTAGMAHKEFASEYNIPWRTVQNWAYGVNQCPDYTWTMLAYCVYSDLGLI